MVKVNKRVFLLKKASIQLKLLKTNINTSITIIKKRDRNVNKKKQNKTKILSITNQAIIPNILQYRLMRVFKT